MDEDSELSSGLEDLRSALGAGDTAPWEDDSTEEPTAELKQEESPDTSSEPTESNDAAPNADAELSQEDISRVLGNPKLQAELRNRWTDGTQRAVQQAIQSARQAWEHEQELRRQAEDEALLDDEELGRRQREMQKLQPVVTRAQAAGYARASQEFLQLGIMSAWETVPELKAMPAEQKTQLDPTNPKFRTYGDYVAALVDAAAETRATKLAESRAKVLADAQVASRLTQSRKSNPSPKGTSGPASPPTREVNAEKMTGMELLKAAFSD